MFAILTPYYPYHLGGRNVYQCLYLFAWNIARLIIDATNANSFYRRLSVYVITHRSASLSPSNTCKSSNTCLALPSYTATALLK